MNQILLNILAAVVTAIVLPLISYIGVRFSTYLNNKIKDETAKRLLSEATQIVLNATRVVFQTYVEALKAEGKFDKDAQLIALNKAKTIVLAELKEDTRSFIEKNYGDLSSWITNQIEASINILKNA